MDKQSEIPVQHPSDQPQRGLNSTLISAAVVAAILGVLVLAWAWVFNTPAPEVGGGEIVVTIPPGSSLATIAHLLAEKKLVNDERAFVWAARLSGVDRKIKPGSYLLPHGITNARMLGLLRRPALRTHDVTIPEGLTAREIGGILHRELDTDSAAFVAACEDTELAYQLAVPAKRLEGYLFPDTYNFFLNTPPRVMIEKMVDRFHAVVGDSMMERIRLAGMTLHEVVTLASIIEGEVQVGSEAALVSAVYHNRLRKHMALEADPTIQYIIPDGPRRLHLSDLALANPYNTYRYLGLPPGPICNPGRRSIKAAIEPAHVDYLYFVAQGDGSHAFNRDYAGHLASKQKLDKIRRDLDLEKKGQGRNITDQSN